mgnify:CR=1 FL=1
MTSKNNKQVLASFGIYISNILIGSITKGALGNPLVALFSGLERLAENECPELINNKIVKTGEAIGLAACTYSVATDLIHAYNNLTSSHHSNNFLETFFAATLSSLLITELYPRVVNYYKRR